VDSYTISEIVEHMVNSLCEKCGKYDCDCCEYRKTLEYVKKLDKRCRKGEIEIRDGGDSP
jgi:hypothetical protein